MISAPTRAIRPACPPFPGATPAEPGTPADFVVVGVPYGSPYRMSGVHSDAANAPAKFRERAATRFAEHGNRYDFALGGTMLGDTGCTLIDVGDLDGDPRDIDGNGRAATAFLAGIVSRGGVPLVLGGDDSVPILLARAFEAASPRVNVLQIDAHIDFADVVGGIDDGYSSPVRRIREMPWIGQIVQVGARGTGSATPQDLADAVAAGNLLFPAASVHQNGIETVLEAMDTTLPWLITLDVDGLDPTIAPGTSCPLPGGLSYLQAETLLSTFGDRHRLAAIDVVEHFPGLDIRDTTSLTLARLLTTLIGRSARQKGSR